MEKIMIENIKSSYSPSFKGELPAFYIKANNNNNTHQEEVKSAPVKDTKSTREKIIDEINILEATHIAMKKAYEEADKMYRERFGKNINMLFVDALKIKKVDIKQVSIVHGDALSISVASASIIAKVTRDRMMIEYDKKYPEYGFAKHKGYGTKAHIDAIKKYGACELHRKSFVKNFS